MHAKFPGIQTTHWPLCRWLAALLLALPIIAKAQSEQPTPTPPDPLAGIPVQVLDQQQVEIGTHIITFNRIAPPVFPAPAPTPAPAPQAQAQTQAAPVAKSAARSPKARTSARSAQTSDAGDGDQEKPYKMLMVSATVYDHQFSELRWYGGNTPELRVYANIDFTLFAGVTEIETADAVYMLIFGLGTDTAASITQAGHPPPDLSQFPANHAGYQIIQGNATDYPEDMAALNALCAYYDANKTQMLADYQQREAANAAHQQWLKDHPPVQPDTVINYWPVKNSVFLKTQP